MIKNMKIVKENIYKTFIRNDKDKFSNLGIGKLKIISDWIEDNRIHNCVINDDFSIDVKGDVDLFNKDITEIPGYIKFNKVDGMFDCGVNYLTSLEFCPYTVGDYFSCRNNRITSLEGCPKNVNGWFDCGFNKISSLKDFTTTVGGNFFYGCNLIPVKEIRELRNKHIIKGSISTK